MKILNKPIRKKLFKYSQIKAQYLGSPLFLTLEFSVPHGNGKDLDVNFITQL